MTKPENIFTEMAPRLLGHLVTKPADLMERLAVLNETDTQRIALYEALEAVQQACLFTEDGGVVGVTTDPHISEELFAQLCAALAKARGEST